jgi:hypothetical protein
MTLGPIVAGIGLIMLTRIAPGGSYVDSVLPAIFVFGIGLSLTVAPLTATVLSAVSDEHAGAASAINNDVSRVAGLVAVATLPQLAGIVACRDVAALTSGFHMAMLITGGSCILGGLVAFLTIRDPEVTKRPASEYHCAVDACPLHSPASLDVAPRPGAP